MSCIQIKLLLLSAWGLICRTGVISRMIVVVVVVITSMLLLLMYLMLLWGFTKRVMYLVIVNTMVLNVMVGKSFFGPQAPWLRQVITRRKLSRGKD